ncbi:bacitracin export permease protein BceB [Clostridium tepidiprofundi DSM 19306]|uniref:Bacitracin export permease protein BceB n=1 Tax=Clostridium tepidiprofundi DSM 19306 TaxID=1121338 RepID=A0A151B475_9CLOT|nr:ABC transporter permease [Clostridium tepidiprofundi]KYH34562.1 bacitracin export permease protein BceB [Clostridium tepidiprofundi DSM 19306]
MYTKVFLGNARRAIKDYIVYIVTLTLCVSLFYAFMSLSSSKYRLIVGSKYKLTNMLFYIKYSTYAITAAMIFLVNYVNKYMIKRRKREFANYVLLGMEQTNVALMFFVETLIIGLVAIVIGILIGCLFSQVLTVLICTTIGSNVSFKLNLYIDTVVITIIFFLVMFVIIGLFNIRTLSNIKLIDMFNDDKKVEIQFSRGNMFYVIVFIVSVSMYILISINMKKHISLCIVGLIIATYGVFYSASYIFIIIKSKCTRFKYNNTNLFLLGNLLSKINTNSFLMANVTLILFASMVLFSMTPILSEWARGYLDYRIVADVRITAPNGYSKLDYTEVYTYLKKSKVGIKNYCEVELYDIDREDSYGKSKMKVPVFAVSLSDYNKLRNMAGYESIKLRSNEFATQWTGYPTDEFIKKYINENSTIEVNNRVFTTNTNKYYNKSLGEGLYYRAEYIIILPDEICNGLSIVQRQFYANTINDMDYEFSSKFIAFVKQWGSKNSSLKRRIHVRVKNYEINSITNISLFTKTQGIYGGVVLMIISLTILSLQQLSDSFDNKDRFKIIKNLGVDSDEINKIILKQIGIYFAVPILVSILVLSIFLCNFVDMFNDIVRVFIGTNVFILNVSISSTIIVLIYISYFLVTYFGFKRNING